MNDDTGYRSGHPTTREGIYESLTYAKLNHLCTGWRDKASI